jgi:diguanylate cyclase
VIAEGRTDFPPELLERLVGQARDGLSDLAGIVGQSRDDAQAYGDALESRAETLVKAGPSPDLIGQFVDLTRALIDRTRDAEARMEEMGGRIEELQTNLDEASRAADCDPLTGLPNRRALERRLARAIADARGEPTPVTLAYCDIDHFKAINDTHGHEIGDRIIKFVGGLLSSAADEDTLVSRYGGEEFVMLFEHVPFARAMAMVNELRLDLGGRTLHVRESGESIGDVTFSAGVAPLEPGQDGAALLQAADRALYAAKKLGRDRVVRACDPRVADSRPRKP